MSALQSVPDPSLTAEAVAELLSVPRLRVYELAREGLIPCFRVGRSIRFRRAAIEEWIARGGTGGRGES